MSHRDHTKRLRPALAVFFALISAACAGGATDRSEPLPATPNRSVLLITIDTLRWDALGSYGAATETPALDALAERGVRFEHAVAHAVVTLPSHATLLTGSDPSRHGVHSNEGHRLGDGASTWAERLGAAGYATGAFVGAFVLDSQFGLAQGFDVYDDDLGDPGEDGPPAVERPAETVVASALDWIGEQDSPWFAWVHVYDPHDPYEAPQPFDDRYADDPYAGEVAYVDHALAPLLDAAAGRDAIVVVTADHGEALGDHGEQTHGLFAYSSTLRVPLIVAGLEGAGEGRVVADRVRHVDVLPTVLSALGQPLDGIQGVPLWGVPPTDESYFEALTPYLDWGWRPLRGVYAGTVKYLDLPTHEHGWPPLHGIYAGHLKYIDLPIPELYDVSVDPNETDNLARKQPADVRRLRDALQAHMAGGGAPEATRVTEDEATLERLRALGYLGGGGDDPAEGIGIDDFGPEDDPKRLVRLEERLLAAVAAIRSDDDPRAILELQEVLRQRPDLVRAWSLLANVQRRLQGPPGEVAVLRRALDAGVRSPYVLARLGRGLAEVGQMGEAQRVAMQGLALAPDDPDLLGLRASLYAESGEVAAAERTFSRALELAPDNGGLHAGRGTLLLSTGRADPAAESFRRALELDDTLAEAHNGLGVIAAREGDLAAAVEHWQAAVEHAPDQPFVLYNLGVTLDRLGRREEAVEALARYLELVPRDAEARALLARLRG